MFVSEEDVNQKSTAASGLKGRGSTSTYKISGCKIYHDDQWMYGKN